MVLMMNKTVENNTKTATATLVGSNGRYVVTIACPRRDFYATFKNLSKGDAKMISGAWLATFDSQFSR